MTRRRQVTLLYDIVEDEEQDAGADEPVYKQVSRALQAREHEVSTLAATSDLKALIGALEQDQSEIIFNLCESLNGEDQHATSVASLLEVLGKRFTGAGAL